MPRRAVIALVFASASLLEVFIDEAERRAWFLYEASHQAPPTA